MAFLFAEVEVLRLTVHCVSEDKRLWSEPYQADPALPQRKAAWEADDDTGSDDHGRSSGSDGKPHKVSDVSQSDKDHAFRLSWTILTWRWTQGRRARNPELWLQARALLPVHFRWI